jgi:ABC-type dipeptide/oligopeptide/nickel transport system ATPase subunit
MSAPTEGVAPALRVDGISAGYGAGSRSARVLRDVSVSIEPGRTMGVVGESGSGKSTLARVLVGQLAPLAGSVSLDGRVGGSCAPPGGRSSWSRRTRTRRSTPG